MKKLDSLKAIGPQIPEPTNKEIEKTIDKVKRKYDFIISISDATKLAKLYKELEWWLLIEKFSREPKSISVESVKEVRAYFKKVGGKDLTIDEAQAKAKTVLDLTVAVEQKRILSEMKKIFDSC